jgi:hypothetical protein
MLTAIPFWSAGKPANHPDNALWGFNSAIVFMSGDYRPIRVNKAVVNKPLWTLHRSFYTAGIDERQGKTLSKRIQKTGKW